MRAKENEVNALQPCKQVIGHKLANSGVTAIYKLNSIGKLMCRKMPNTQFAKRCGALSASNHCIRTSILCLTKYQMNEYKPDYENMKYGLTILLLLLSIVVHGQIQQLVIMDNQGNDECAIQAFIVQGNKTFIDRCYIGIDDDFEDLKEIPSEPIFNKLLQLDIQEFYRLSGDINYQAYNKPCDAILPIAFVIGDKIIEWKRIDNCYPESAKNYAEGIIKVFEKY